MGRELAAAIARARRVYIIGNGGSYANAAHIANDLICAGVKAYTLDPATLTAIANDFGYENVFERWLQTVAEPEDLLIALSGSGTSPNIVKAMEFAGRIGMSAKLITWRLQGINMQESEERQIVIGHEARSWLEAARQHDCG